MPIFFFNKNILKNLNSEWLGDIHSMEEERAASNSKDAELPDSSRAKVVPGRPRSSQMPQVLSGTQTHWGSPGWQDGPSSASPNFSSGPWGIFASNYNLRCALSLPQEVERQSESRGSDPSGSCCQALLC